MSNSNISSKNAIVEMGDIVDKIKEGYRSINGIPAFGKAEYILGCMKYYLVLFVNIYILI